MRTGRVPVSRAENGADSRKRSSGEKQKKRRNKQTSKQERKKERAKERKNDGPKKERNGEMILYANHRRGPVACVDCSGKSVIS